jgi:circadian clock protein KaiB
MGAAELKPWMLRLYVTAATPKSARAIVNTRRLLEEHLHGRYSLEIVNIAEHVAQAIGDQIVCTPTLLRLAPSPVRRIIGDASDVERVLKGLEVPAAR